MLIKFLKLDLLLILRYIVKTVASVNLDVWTRGTWMRLSELQY